MIRLPKPASTIRSERWNSARERPIDDDTSTYSFG